MWSVCNVFATMLKYLILYDLPHFSPMSLLTNAVLVDYKFGSGAIDKFGKVFP